MGVQFDRVVGLVGSLGLGDFVQASLMVRVWVPATPTIEAVQAFVCSKKSLLRGELGGWGIVKARLSTVFGLGRFCLGQSKEATVGSCFFREP